MKTIKIDSEKLVEVITECVKKQFITEKRGLQSKILHYMIKSHGKPEAYGIDLSAIVDGDILDVNEDNFKPLTQTEFRNYQRIKYPDIWIDKITFSDGAYIICKRGRKQSEYNEKMGKRFVNHNQGIDGKDTYRWKNTEAEDLIFKNPYFRKEWEKKYQDKALDNVKNNRRLHDGFEDI